MPVDSHRPELMDLVSSYQQLAAEAKRRDVPVRETCEAAIAALQAPSSTALSTLSEITRASEHVLLTPIMLGCQSKNNKVVTLALNALQRLTASPGASSTAPPLGPAALPPVIASLKHVVQNQAVDSQLKILQVLPTLLSSASQHIHQQLLFDILLLCFKLQESKVGVVSSTAAATLRQLVIILFDAVLEEDRRKTTDSTHKVTLGPENITVSLRPCALDAFQVFQDLCHLISSPPTSATHLQLSTLPKTFGLELIESVLSDFPTLFHKDSHPELHHLIKQDLSPLLIRSLAGDATTVPTFSITLRLMRVIFLLLKSFADEMPTECEVRLHRCFKQRKSS